MRKRGSRVSQSTWAEFTTVTILSQLHTPVECAARVTTTTLFSFTHPYPSHSLSLYISSIQAGEEAWSEKHIYIYIYTSYKTDNCYYYWWWKHIHHQSRDITTGTGKGDGYKHVHNNNNKRKCNSCNTKRVLTRLWGVIEMCEKNKNTIYAYRYYTSLCGINKKFLGKTPLIHIIIIVYTDNGIWNNVAINTRQ